MTEREKILGRIQEALRVPAPRPGEAHAVTALTAGHGPSSKAAAPSQPRQWLPVAGGTPEERLALFARNSTELKAEFRLVAGREEMGRVLIEMREREGWTKVGTHRGGWTEWACETLGLPVCFTDGGYEVAELERCSAGISECDALVAQTGSVLVTSRSAGGRALSVLPPHHVVLAQRDQLIGDLTDAFGLLKRKYGSNYPSLISFITGPSRTGDIERILVLGAHGPKKLTILCL